MTLCPLVIVLTHNCEDGLPEGGLEERCFPGDLATELPRRVQVHVPQHDLSLGRLLNLEQNCTNELSLLWHMHT